MTTDFEPPVVQDDSPSETQSDRTQIWIIGSRDQVVHLMNEFYVKRIATDFPRLERAASPTETLRERVKFTPLVPALFATGKYMAVLVR